MTWGMIEVRVNYEPTVLALVNRPIKGENVESALFESTYEKRCR